MKLFFLFLLSASACLAQRSDFAVNVERDVAYAGTDNPRQKLDLYLPKEKSGKLPVIVFIHGGGWKAGDKSSAAPKLLSLVNTGKFAGVSVAYRLTNEAQWPAQIHDCKAAIRWVRGNAEKYGFDAEKIAAWGTSAGGHLVSFLGTSGDVKELEGDLGDHDSQSSAVNCVVNFFGPENFLTMVSQESTVDRTTSDYPEALLLGGRVQDKADTAKQASPITHISKGDAAFLTAHGTMDPLIPFAQAVELHDKLKAAGVSSVLVTMKEGGHGFASPELDAMIHKFLDLHLRGQATELADATLTPSAAPRMRPRPGPRPRSSNN
ncbi:MAG: alpha/beta hydrolase [Verrucomicrobiaceae bacterium]|nr:alpha/beta hydrolase [Verrucomicrobiaceae bacterium]